MLILLSLLTLAARADVPAALQAYCPSGNPFNSLAVGETAQKPDQPLCESKSGGYSDFRCPAGTVTGSFYYVPMEGHDKAWSYYTTLFDCMDYGTKNSSLKHTIADGKKTLVCKPASVSAAMKPPGCCKPAPSPGAINVEGSGILKDKSVLEYDGSKHPNTCQDVFGGPTVLAGGSRKCLIPFISVACDVKNKVYEYGTVFDIPRLRGKVFAMPPEGKRTFRHPGYVICEDSGSAITGQGRFDFFVGTFGDTDKLNYFSSVSAGPADLRMDVKNCNKAYTALKVGTPEWKKGIDAIILATRNGLPSKDFSIWLTGPIHITVPAPAAPPAPAPAAKKTR